MNTNERDTHFSGVAKLFYADLVKLFTAMLSCRVLGQDDNAAYTEQVIKELLAQRAYDLVEYALRVCPLEAFEITGDGVQYVPDLAGWPIPPV